MGKSADYETAGVMLGNIAITNGLSKARLNYFDLVSEHDYGISGLLLLMSELRKRV